jgi:hypothetical protein
MPNCRRCGSFVSTDFIRVFGGNERVVFGCLDCTTAIDLFDGNAARQDP